MKTHTLKSLLEENSSNNTKTQMSAQYLENFVQVSKNSEVLEVQKGYVLFKYLGAKMALLCDEEHNRMRIISPITEYSSLAPKIKDALMTSNFSSTLDARYAVAEDTLYAAFMHSLSSLHEEDFESALKQVSNLTRTFGTTYSSAQLAFTKKK